MARADSLTTHTCLAPSLKISADIPPLNLSPSMAQYCDNFFFSQLFNVHGVKDVGQAETHTAEPLVPEPSAFEVELAIGKLKSHKS